MASVCRNTIQVNLVRIPSQLKQLVMQEGDLSPKVTPLLKHIPQQSRQFCDTVGELTMVLRLYSQMFRLSKSRHRLFILS